MGEVTNVISRKNGAFISGLIQYAEPLKNFLFKSSDLI